MKTGYIYSVKVKRIPERKSVDTSGQLNEYSVFNCTDLHEVYKGFPRYSGEEL